MKRYNAEDPDDVADAANLNAEPWQLDLLALNPEYCWWGVGEDHMTLKGNWGSTVAQGWHERPLDNMNEVVNFHFELRRPSENCAACAGRGDSPQARRLAEDWYGFGDSPRWDGNITDDEAAALVAAGRFPEGSTAKSINAGIGRGPFGHDAINRWICVSARCKRLGYPESCTACDGRGHFWTSDVCSVDLTLWLLFPRKGAAPGVRMEGIQRDDLPKVFAFLRAAAERNAARFAKVPT